MKSYITTKLKPSAMIAKEEKLELNSTQIQDNEEYDYVTVPPDGGFGWIVLVACFFIGLTVDGFVYSFGAISDDLKKYYQCQEWAVSFVISLTCGCYWLSAPLASALCNKWGCRPIGILGSIIASGAVAASVLSPNIYVMWLLFGFIGGIGLGTVYLSSLVMVGYYFEEKQAIAMGIVTSGAGVGSIIFGPLSRILFNRFGWKGGLLFEAGILLTCALWCGLMVPLKPIRKRRLLQPALLVDDNEGIHATKRPLINNNEETNTSEPTTPHRSYEDSNITETVPHNRSSTDSTISVKSPESIKAEDAVHSLHKEDKRFLPEDAPVALKETINMCDAKRSTSQKVSWDKFQSMSGIILLKDKKILIICLASIWVVTGYYIPYLFIVKMAVNERNISEQNAVYLLSLIGFSNTAVRFVSGWLTKIPYLSPLLVNNVGLLIAGVASLFVPVCSTYPHLVIYCIVWGGFIALHVSLSSVIVCRIVGLENYSSALGVTLMFRGIATFIAPPTMGAIRDLTSSFDVPFIVGGIGLLIGAVMYFSLMWIDHREKASSKNHQQPSSTSATTRA